MEDPIYAGMDTGKKNSLASLGPARWELRLVLTVQLHSLQVEMRTRFAMLRDSYQHQLDTLHVQVADIEATCKLPRLPRMGDGFAAAPAPRGEVAGHMGAGPRHGSGGAAERAHWDHGGRRSPELQETPEHARPRVRDGRERPGLRGGEAGTGEARSWGEQEFWEAGAAQQDALCAQSAESGRGSSDAPQAAPVRDNLECMARHLMPLAPRHQM